VIPTDAHSARLEDRPHAVYRMLDENDAPLYIGCTYDVAQALLEQRSVTPLWARTARVTTEWHPTRSDALAAEAAAIRAECPYWNRHHTDHVDEVARALFVEVHGRHPRFLEHWDHGRRHHAEVVRRVHARRAEVSRPCVYERIR
jgi:predicted GIY-YIG superfamily endonuclease